MNLLVFVPYPVEGASNRYRVNQYVPYLQQHGVRCDLRPFLTPELYRMIYRPGRWLDKARLLPGRLWQRVLDTLDARRYDAVLVHRECLPVGPALIESVVARLGAPLIYDFDDAIYLPDQSPLKNALKHPAKVPAIIRLATQVIVCNEHLRSYCQPLNPRVTVIPTVVDTDRFCARKAASSGGPIRLGWVGSHSTARYLERIAPALRAVARRHPIELVVVGAGSEVYMDGVSVRNQPWRLDTEVEDFRSFDIGVYPLEDDDWVQGKGGFKTIQFMAVGVPAVVSAVGANRTIVQDGETGFLVDSTSAWVDRLLRLIEDPALRLRLGEAGRRVAVERYSMQAHAPRLLEVIRAAAAPPAIDPRAPPPPAGVGQQPARP